MAHKVSLILWSNVYRILTLSNKEILLLLFYGIADIDGTFVLLLQRFWDLCESIEELSNYIIAGHKTSFICVKEEITKIRYWECKRKIER